MSSTRITDYATYISSRSAARKPSAVRALQPLLAIPGMISLGGGYPDTATFPFESVTMKLKTGETLEIGKEDMAKVLQYNATAGLPQLVSWLRDLQIHLHHPPLPASEWDICVTTGSQDGLAKAFEMLLEPGQPILVETPAYSGILAILRPAGVKIVEVPSDSDGLDPTQLRRILSSWPSDAGPRPRVLYTVPEGGNPTGNSTMWERKQEVYEVCAEYGVIILEDDPYYLLQFSDKPQPSYFSIDVDGRVLRFDSFSKVLSSGIRVGWCTGPKQLVERIVLHGQASNLHPSNLSQELVSSYLHHLGHVAYLEHARGVRDHYAHKRDLFLKAAEKHLGGPQPAAEWVNPKAGMFVWLKLVGVADSGKLVREKAVERKVLLLPGEEFIPSGRPTPFVRAAFSTATEEQMDEALRRLGELVRGEWQASAK
ncbi:PLP-dependent transferase [Gonapodya prolifera JEL478]|uniref:PLP-dependent transferase n=1 Tax=Gonapodya prolifera (strain JEL478) TaxID=1344416 RepID=A0A139A657_GONPJ|nr:PLP-dependent transferase [Gonapodya prolifera JEL478]|eukprot:KXS11935.1 PLP-dependent transferase [Gonapodya prolifera JEL478]